MNIETYLGFRIEVTTELAPFKLTVLKEKMLQLAELADFDPDDFFVYFHSVGFIETERKHFLKDLSLSQRVERMEITYDVNPKQIKSGLIRFLNNYVDISIDLGIIDYWSSEYKLIRVYPGSFFEQRGNHHIEIITFVHKDLRRQHYRKIKLTCQAFPSDAAVSKIQNKKEFHETKIDLRLDKRLKLNFTNYTQAALDSMKREIEQMKSNNSSSFNGPESQAKKGQAENMPAPSQQLNVFVNPVDIRINVKGDISALEKGLTRLDIDKKLVREVIDIVKDEKEPLSGNWLKKVSRAVMTGLGDISTNAIGGLVVELVKKYYGID